MYFPLLFVGVLCLSSFCYTLLCVHFSFAIILKRKRKLVTMLLLSRRCFVTINVLWLFFMVLLVGLKHFIVVFPDHTHLLLKPVLFRLTIQACIYIYSCFCVINLPFTQFCLFNVCNRQGFICDFVLFFDN